ncbi:hypothetical protein [Thermoactinomyces mirandus]|uniref:Uncharacterized protein n=1 Tax=Thermoactinomyces mirandus TaxID=2756294 RepID=A0A7W1XUT6_9BACL|nr:hypothetical protein [Thermoactinomyces mirandus]MBA4603656.1 hypothetical protein [Thermoactinomyces mirandus]
MLGSSGEVYAGGSFDVSKVNDGFNQFEQDSPSQQEQTGSTPSVEEEKGFWDLVTQPFADAWDWTKDKLSGAWKWTKEKASIFVNWLASVLSKITGVVVDTLADTWDWIVKFKEYIAFAGVLILRHRTVYFCSSARDRHSDWDGSVPSHRCRIERMEVRQDRLLGGTIGGLLGLIGRDITRNLLRIG